MRFGNIGNKDQYGKQRRIEHRGKYLRVSRTGGVSVRAQLKAAGFNFTGNVRRGARVSRTIATNTQVAMQNGRFILRGRYGKGPTKMNLSKTGATVSTRNRMGTVNWVKPGRSSAKIAGVQVRGKNAIVLQIVYWAFAAVLFVIQAIWRMVVSLFQASASWAALSMRDRRNARLGADAERMGVQAEVDGWNREQTLAGLMLVFCAWGRGVEALPMTGLLHERIRQDASLNRLIVEKDVLIEMSNRLVAIRDSLSVGDEALVLLSCIATRAQQVIDPDVLPELIMELDELALKDGARTEGQDEMLEVISDFAGLMLESPDDVE